MELSELLKELRDETLHPFPAPETTKSESIRERIEKILSSGPVPYAEILEAVGGDEDQIRDAIRDWPELIAFTDKDGLFMWELVKDPVFIGERIAIRFEAETPSDLGKPCFTYRGHVLAWETDPPHIKVYSWATCNLFPGRPLAVDAEPVARLLGLSSQEVRGALARLVKEGDLVMTRERGRELYKLVVNY